MTYRDQGWAAISAWSWVVVQLQPSSSATTGGGAAQPSKRPTPSPNFSQNFPPPATIGRPWRTLRADDYRPEYDQIEYGGLPVCVDVSSQEVLNSSVAHHLRRLRQASVPGQGSAAAVRYAKQEITEAIKFLTWLHSTHHRTLATCLQQDVEEWLASGPTTRSKIRNLLAWAK